MNQEAETDGEEIISLDDTLVSLKRNANAVEIYYQQSVKHFKSFQHKVYKESNSISERPLQPRTRMMKWLTDRNLSVESTFQEFFEAFVDEHKKDHRVDVSKRTIRLNSSASILFGYKDMDPVISLYDLLGKLNVLYY